MHFKYFFFALARKYFSYNGMYHFGHNCTINVTSLAGKGHRVIRFKCAAYQVVLQFPHLLNAPQTRCLRTRGDVHGGWL